MCDPEVAMQKALIKYADCTYADWDFENSKIIIELWESEQSYLKQAEPKYIMDGNKI